MIDAKYGAFKIQVFGLVARGEAIQNSDVDCLIKLSPKRTLLDRIGR